MASDWKNTIVRITADLKSVNLRVEKGKLPSVDNYCCPRCMQLECMLSGICGQL